MARGIFLALETTEEEVTYDNTEMEQMEAEIEVAELVEEQQEISEDTETVDAAMADATELSDIAEVMEDSVEKEEGLDEDAAKMAQIVTESICVRLNYKPKTAIIPATEAFAQVNSRLASTKAALESVGETLQRIWTAIKEFFANIWNKIKNIIKSFADANERLKNRIASVETALADNTVFAAGAPVEIKSDKYEKIFRPSSSSLYPAIMEVLKSHQAVTKHVKKTNAFISSSIAKAYGDKDSNFLSDWYSSFKADSAVSSIAKGMYSNGIKLVMDETSHQFTVDTPEAVMPKGNLKSINFNDSVKLVSAVKELSDSITEAKEGFAEAEKATKEAIKVVEKKAKAGEATEGQKEVISVLRANQKLIDLVNTKMPVLSFKAANAALSYVQDSIAAVVKANKA